MIEAKDNVRFMTSIEKYWDPLYRCEPREIADFIPPLLAVLRRVYNSSHFFNTSERMTSFLSKVTNQLIVASQNYLTENYQKAIWSENMTDLVRKIGECKTMQDVYRSTYFRMLREIEERGDKPLTCSTNFLFTRLDKFTIRLSKIREIMEICLRYQVLKRIPITGMEQFLEKIEFSFTKISETSYDPLEYRKNHFNHDFLHFQKEISVVELEMALFVKNYIEPIPTAAQRVLTLKRFQKLNLNCLKLSERFVDLAGMLIGEIENVKDKYNEDRGRPPIGRCVTPACGRITWARSLFYKIDTPMKSLTAYKCINNHPNSQLCVKLFNFLGHTLLSYEATTHKAWYTYVDQVRSKLEVPILNKNPETNRYEINLNPYVQQSIKECEGMWKLGLEVPEMTAILTFCQDKVFNAYNKIKELVRRNDKLRHSIYPIFLPLMRIHLIKLERVFAPALSQVTWLTFEIDEYFAEVEKVLWPIESFVKDISDVNDAQIEVLLGAIQYFVLVYLPDEAVTPEEFNNMNVEHRLIVEKMVEIKSLAAEKAAVDLINRFIEKAQDVPYRDESGKFRLSKAKINEDNWRIEESKPINKFDWLQFDKIYKPVGYATEEDNLVLCYKDYDGLNYDITLLHIDCVELFAYYNHRMISVLAKCTKKSMEMLKVRILNFLKSLKLTNFNNLSRHDQI